MRQVGMRLGIGVVVVATFVLVPVQYASALGGYSTPVWSRTFPVGDGESSPTVANLDGENDIVFGSLDGKVYAVKGSNGQNVSGFPRQTRGRGIMSSPSIADTNNDGKNEIFIGAGDADGNPANGKASGPGGYYSLNNQGGVRWWKQADDHDYLDHSVSATMPIGDINYDNQPDVTAGAVSLSAYSIRENGQTNAGWPIQTDDSTWSSPALVDVNGDGRTDVVTGGDSTAGNWPDWDGGILRAIDGSGRIIWYYKFDDIIRSSPAVGDITGDGIPEIVVGTGNFWYNYKHGNTQDSKKLWVFDLQGHLKWSKTLAGTTMASPALADITGDGVRDVLIGTWDPSGKIYAFTGNGSAVANFNGKGSPGGVILAQIVTADLNNDGKQDLLVPTGSGVYAFDAATGNTLFVIRGGQAWYQSSPWVGDIDSDGSIDIVTVGNIAGQGGVVDRFELTGAVLGNKGYPQFRFDTRRTGNVSGAPLRQDPCTNPGDGYRLIAADGGVFAYCDSSYLGSMGGTVLNKPIVASAATPSRNGYWMAASDGGIFTFGDARFKGSTGSIRLNKPIVGMASTSSGNGYWMVASDGGIFTFGDARFKGSMGGKPLNKPIVGMAPTPTGNGYWLVASDGGIFSFGDARFRGSTGSIRLNKPIVGMTPTASGNGYWFVANDGGIFSFGDAQFKGSMGGQSLNSPIVSMRANATGSGYWLVTAKGTVFGFGGAAPYGSVTGGLAKPIIGMTL